jgi:predicted RNA binding protein YcfA (HicA-like mRNA interferase family)
MTETAPELEARLEREIRRLCCNNTRDAKYNDIKWVMERLGYYEEPGGNHMRFRRKNYKPLIVANHKPLRPIYLKAMCKYLEENGFWSSENCR